MVFRIGVLAVVLSFVPWLAVVAAPFVGLSLGEGAGLVAGLVVAAEVLFWVGLALAGKDTWQAVRARGWRHAPRELWRLLRHGRPAGAEATGRDPGPRRGAGPGAPSDPHPPRRAT